MKFLKFGNSKNYIVFLHGWGADKSSFLFTKNYFDDYTLIYVDFPGFGESTEPEKPWSVFDYTQELKTLLDGFDIEKLMLVGHSFGGRVAIKYSFLYQHDYNDFKLCLVDSAGLKPRRGLIYYWKIYKFKLLKKIANKFKFCEKTLSKFGSSDYKVLSFTMKETFKKVVNEDLSYDARYISKPTIIFWGSKDKDTKLYMAKRLNKLVIGSKLFIAHNAGHFSFLDKPQEFLIILDSFLRN